MVNAFIYNKNICKQCRANILCFPYTYIHIWNICTKTFGKTLAVRTRKKRNKAEKDGQAKLTRWLGYRNQDGIPAIASTNPCWTHYITTSKEYLTNSHILSIYFKLAFLQLHLVNISCKLVIIWVNYERNKKGARFFETQCSSTP